MIIDKDKSNVQTERVINFLVKSAAIEINNPITDIPIHTISCNSSLTDPIIPRILVKNITYQMICSSRAIFKLLNKNAWLIFPPSTFDSLVVTHFNTWKNFFKYSSLLLWSSWYWLVVWWTNTTITSLKARIWDDNSSGFDSIIAKDKSIYFNTFLSIVDLELSKTIKISKSKKKGGDFSAEAFCKIQPVPCLWKSYLIWKPSLFIQY